MPDMTKTERLKEIFGKEIPSYALEFIDKAETDGVTPDQIFATLRMIKDSRTDPRVTRALIVAKQVYGTPTATFEELYDEEQQSKIMNLLAFVFVAVFKDIDTSKPHVRISPLEGIMPAEERPVDHVTV